MVNAILMETQEATLDGDKKLKRYDLAIKINKTVDTVDLTIEEIAAIKQCIAKFYNILVMGQIWKYLDNPETLVATVNP